MDIVRKMRENKMPKPMAKEFLRSGSEPYFGDSKNLPNTASGSPLAIRRKGFVLKDLAPLKPCQEIKLNFGKALALSGKWYK